MSAADAVAAILFLGIVLYSVFGGADFGSGVWDLAAGGSQRGGAVRRLVDHSIGPVWEANHVWLIFVLVYLWTAFPQPFVSFVGTVYVPLSFVGLGIILRGAGFAYRKYADDLYSARIYGALFAGSSLITPFFFGMIAGAVVSGRVPAEGYGDRVTSWLGPTSWLGGVMAVLVCAFLAAVFMARDADRLGQDKLTRYFRRRAIVTSLITGAVSLGGIGVLFTDAPTLADGLTGRALPLVLVSGIGGIATVWLLIRRQYGRARITAVVSVGSVVLGWGVAQYPWLLVDQVTIADGAGASATLTGLIIAFVAAAVLAVPSLVALFVLVERGMVSGGEDIVDIQQAPGADR